MLRMLPKHHISHLRPSPGTSSSSLPLCFARFKRYEAYDKQFDQEALESARKWFQGFETTQLPAGSTTYARSSGPGGQHVNKSVRSLLNQQRERVSHRECHGLMLLAEPKVKQSRPMLSRSCWQSYPARCMPASGHRDTTLSIMTA
jgi:hypothetical protein